MRLGRTTSTSSWTDSETEIASLLWDAILGNGRPLDEAVLVSARSESVALSVGREKVLRRASDRVEILRTTPCLLCSASAGLGAVPRVSRLQDAAELRRDRRVLEARGSVLRTSRGRRRTPEV